MPTPTNADVARAAYPVFRRAVKAAVPWPIWLLIGKWLLKILEWALDAGLFGQRLLASGGVPLRDLDDYAPEVRDAILGWAARTPE